MFTRISYRRYLLMLGMVFAIDWALLAINPNDRGDWALENVLVALFLFVLVRTYRVFPLSSLSYTLIFIFLVLHEIGAHYTYAQVPYDEGLSFLFDFSPNVTSGFTRNNFDRAVDFSYGLLLAYPIREAFIRLVSIRGSWSYILPLGITMFTTMLFELFGWGVAEFFGGDLGVAYLGTQGDVWDAQRGMALASLGALIAMLATAAVNRALRRDFAAEWNDSLRAKIFQPLGENELKHMPKKRRR